jgi:hypothetical protein
VSTRINQLANDGGCSGPWNSQRFKIGFSCSRAVEIRHRGGAVDHRVAAGARFGRGLLQIVPMLDDQTIFEAKDVEANAWPEEVLFRVSEDIIAVFKDTDGVD